jgi:hypothetical protein
MESSEACLRWPMPGLWGSLTEALRIGRPQNEIKGETTSSMLCTPIPTAERDS